MFVKVEEVHAVPMRDIVEITPSTTVSEIKRLEKDILTALEYEVHVSHISPPRFELKI